MTYLIVLEVDENEAAPKLVERLHGARDGKVRVTGLFRLPSPGSYCTCPRTYDYTRELVKGERFGWWIHSTCRKPRPGGQRPKNLRTLLEGVSPNRHTWKVFVDAGEVSSEAIRNPPEPPPAKPLPVAGLDRRAERRRQRKLNKQSQ